MVAVLIVLHHDFWFWEDSRLVMGFLPIGMAYHIGISIIAAAFWFWAIQYAWPTDVDDIQDRDTA